MSGLQSKLFLGWDPASPVETSVDDVRGAEQYSRRYFDSSGALVRLELYDRGELTEVDYYSGDRRLILAAHVREYPGVEFAVIRGEPAPAGFRWEFTTWYAADGELRKKMTHLFAPGDLEIMNLDYGPGAELVVITKFYWETPERLSIAFEYRADGVNVDVADLEEGESLRFNEVLRMLPGAEFYADGRVLPEQLAGVSIPSFPEY